MPGVFNCWINPWFLFPDRNLIASPGKDSQGQLMSGTRLSPKEIISAIWASCLPIANAQLDQCHYRDTDKKLGSEKNRRLTDIHGFTFDQKTDTGKQPIYRYVRWPRDDEVKSDDKSGVSFSTSAGGATVTTGTAERLLATIASRLEPGVPGYDELLLADEYDRVDLGGGFALVTDKGVLVVDDWGERDLCEGPIWDALRSTARLKQRIVGSTQAVAAQTDKLGELSLEGPLSKKISKAVVDVAEIRAKVSAISIIDERGKLTDQAAIRLHTAICERWNLDQRVEAVNTQVERIEESVIAMGERRSGIAIKYLGLFGLPLFGASNFSKHITGLFAHSIDCGALMPKLVAKIPFFCERGIWESITFFILFVLMVWLSFYLVNRVARPNEN
jgi:hypothetical protein